MALTVKEDEPAEPSDVSLLGSAVVVARTLRLAHAVEQTGLALGTDGIQRSAERR